MDKPKKLKLTRAYWSKGEGLKKMADAIADWEPELQKPEDKRMSLHLFAEVHNIPYTSLQTHITTDDSKRIKLGSGVGAKCIIDLSTTDVIVDVLVRKDRANQGAGVGEALDSLSKCASIAPTRSSTEPFDRAFRRTVRPSDQDRLANPVAAQPTTYELPSRRHSSGAGTR